MRMKVRLASVAVCRSHTLHPGPKERICRGGRKVLRLWRLLQLMGEVVGVMLTVVGRPVAVHADYLRPAQAGFHHCALIYERPTRTRDDLLPYVTRLGKSRGASWLFDAFLFLRFSMPSGARTDEGPTFMADWRKHLDDWFADGRDLHALDEAVGMAARTPGKLPRRRKIVLSIPYPSPGVGDFGFEQGGSADLRTEEGVARAVRWYVSEAISRFRQARFRHLDMWGFYWMREEVSPRDEARVRCVARVVHEANLRFLWIPWWKAPGWDRWRSLGFDAAIMQPNYAFVSSTHGGSVRRNRLAVAAELCRANGMGVEMEAGDLVHSRSDRQAFLHYLADGGPDRLGYREAACAWYLGGDTVEQTARASAAAVRRCYEAMADFITGRTVAEPGYGEAWRRTRDGFAARLCQPADVSCLDIFFEEPEAGNIWRGRVEVTGRASARASWLPLGWALRTCRDREAGRHQVVTVPIEARVREVRVRMCRLSGPATLARPSLQLSSVGPEGVRQHLASGCLYDTDLTARRAYDDDGTKLTDGLVPASGFPEGRSVGWFRPRAAVVLDLGAVRRVSEVQVECQGGGYGAVNWPASPVAFLSATSIPPRRLAGTGSWPRDGRWALAMPVELTRRRSPTDMDGVLRFPVSPPALARYVSIVLGGNGWIMLGEVRVMDGVRNLAREVGVSYRLQPLPSLAHDVPPRYQDDGERLTDGVIARSFVPHQLTGWDDGQAHSVTLDLGAARRVAGVTAWSLKGGQAAIYAPRSITVECSEDGVTWHWASSAEWPRTAEDGRTCVAAPCRAAFASPRVARYVRTRITPSQGWCMLSEVEVHSAR